MMNSDYLSNLGITGIPQEWLVWVVPISILDIVLKGFALWKSAQRGQKVWFVFLLLVNSMGLLPALYLILHREKVTKK